MSKKTAIIIGAGPAGLTAAYELLTRTDIKPIVLESSSAYVGGISKTVVYKGNRIDIGGHRFFSKSDRVMNWWMNILPVQSTDQEQIKITYQQQSRDIRPTESADASSDNVMLVRNRLSRIYFNKMFFPYPITLSWETISKLGLWRMIKIGASYVYRRLIPVHPETNLEAFFLNRFGDELYKTFFQSYTEKVWGMPCKDISADWGAQRIKGLSVTKVIAHYFKSLLQRNGGVGQKDTETSLIEKFLYPKFGPGQMWEVVAQRVLEMGGEVHMGERATGISTQRNRATSVTVATAQGEKTYEADYVFSTMPINELIRALKADIPDSVHRIAKGLKYRDFITIGLLLRNMCTANNADAQNKITDNWIYIHEPNVHVGRLQIFNNWSEFMVHDPATTWVGMEYFCNEGDTLWSMSDEDLLNLGKKELVEIGLCRSEDIMDGMVLREKKAYPAYFGTYDEFDKLRSYTDGFENLFLVGRNGMHRYNNQDHSMLTAMTAVDNIIAGRTDKENMWAVNTEQEYHEKK